jgi:hypothetical protein
MFDYFYNYIIMMVLYQALPTVGWLLATVVARCFCTVLVVDQYSSEYYFILKHLQDIKSAETASIFRPYRWRVAGSGFLRGRSDARAEDDMTSDQTVVHLGGLVWCYANIAVSTATGADNYRSSSSTLSVTLFGLGNMKQRLVDMVAAARANNGKNVIIYGAVQSGYSAWSPLRVQPCRSVTSVAYQDRLLENTFASHRTFLTSAVPRLKERGIRLQRKYLLTGPRGCGKTTFVSLLAAEFGYDIYSVDVNSFLPAHRRSGNNGWSVSYVSGIPSNAIVVLEDIDRLFMLESDTQNDDQRVSPPPPPSLPSYMGPMGFPGMGMGMGLDMPTPMSGIGPSGMVMLMGTDAMGDMDTAPPWLSKPKAEASSKESALTQLLDLLDGQSTPACAMIVMTCNHPEVLPDVLTRAGRVHAVIQFDKLDAAQLGAFFTKWEYDADDVAAAPKTSEWEAVLELAAKGTVSAASIHDALVDDCVRTATEGCQRRVVDVLGAVLASARLRASLKA